LQKLDRGQYINVADDRGATLMHKIVERDEGQEDFIAQTYQMGAVIDHKDAKGKTARRRL